ncbi:hypothetical protein A3Q56_00995, partial [Intoshia linei]
MKLATFNGTKGIIVGGTFDRFHKGHKSLIDKACSINKGTLMIGITEDELNTCIIKIKNLTLFLDKTLAEFIEPLNVRMANVEQYVKSVLKDDRKFFIELLLDKYGNSIKCDEAYIICTLETSPTVDEINEIREKLGLVKLDKVMCDGIKIGDEKFYYRKYLKNNLISSTNYRIDMLGTLISNNKYQYTDFYKNVYVIGLTGSIASGKSSISKLISEYDSIVIDADKICHEIYNTNEMVVKKIASVFGDDVVRDGRVNRSNLGLRVFKDSDDMEKLTSIVWPPMILKIKKQIERIEKENDTGRRKIIIIDAAIIIEAKCYSLCHEVWICSIPKQIALERVMKRNQLSKVEAEQRYDSQMSPFERKKFANVVFCTKWDTDFTKYQVKRA